jgi:rare lipoprotein A
MIKSAFILLVGFFALTACSELELGSHVVKTMGHGPTATKAGDFKVGNPYKIKGRMYRPHEQYQGSETGIASWYGPGFHGKLTANGEIFNRNDLTAAHRTLQMPSMVRVTNLDNGKSLIVRVNDRGPFAHDRVIDLSEKAAGLLGFKRAGTANVRIDVLERESRQVASAAKNGLSTRGTEVALNRREPLTEMARVMPTPNAKPYIDEPYVQAVAIKREATHVTPYNENRFNTMISNRVLTKPNVKTVSLPVRNHYFVQAGAFASEDNALTLKQALYNIDAPSNVYRTVNDGRILYRVKIGPVESVEKADEITTLLNRQGRDAKILNAVTQQ